MRTFSFSRLIPSLIIATGIIVVVAAYAVSSHAATTNANTLTFSRSVALPGVVLPAGTYVFDIANPDSSHDVVIVRQNGHVHYMGFTLPVHRPPRMPLDQPVTLREARPDTAAPIDTWFPLGSSSGHQFIYR